MNNPMPLKIAYFDRDAATSWVSPDVGEKLANELKNRYGYVIVNYNDLINVVKTSILNDSAAQHAVVFVNDVVPHELFSDNIDPMNTLLMRFIAKGGIVVWIGDTPFWYRTSEGNKGQKEFIADKLLPFKALGVFTVFTESPMTASKICAGSRCAAWIPRRPIIYPVDIEAGTLEDCGKNHKYIHPLTKTVAFVSNIYPLPMGEIDFTIRRLKPGWLDRIGRWFRGARVGGGVIPAFVEFEVPKQEVPEERRVPSRTPYWETAPAWIRCFGMGYFIRLFDEPWSPNIVSNKDVEDRAFIINYYIEKLLYKQA